MVRLDLPGMLLSDSCALKRTWFVGKQRFNLSHCLVNFFQRSQSFEYPPGLVFCLAYQLLILPLWRMIRIIFERDDDLDRLLIFLYEFCPSSGKLLLIEYPVFWF